MKWFDLKWLKQWWDSEPRRKPKPTKPKVLRNWRLKGVRAFTKENAVILEPRTLAATKSEARAAFKKICNLSRKSRLPEFGRVVEEKS